MGQIRREVKVYREKIQKLEEENELEDQYFKLKEAVEAKESRLKALMEEEGEAIEELNDLIAEMKE